MSRSPDDSTAWAMVDEGWGRKAADFSALSEPGNCREYVAGPPPTTASALDRLVVEGRVARPTRRGLPEPLQLDGDPYALTRALEEIRRER